MLFRSLDPFSLSSKLVTVGQQVQNLFPSHPREDLLLKAETVTCDVVNLHSKQNEGRPIRVVSTAFIHKIVSSVESVDDDRGPSEHLRIYDVTLISCMSSWKVKTK